MAKGQLQSMHTVPPADRHQPDKPNSLLSKRGFEDGAR